MILDGLALSKKIGEKLKKKISSLKEVPKLAIIQVGDVSQSTIFISRKIKYAKDIGADTEHVKFPETISEDDLRKKLGVLNKNPNIHGIIIQLPLPKHLNFFNLVDVIGQEKDVDGLGLQNIRGLFSGERHGIIPATVRGILSLLKEYKIEIKGKKVVIINRSVLVGKPLALALLNENATVSICHSQTKNLKQEIQTADIVISAIGKPKILGSDYFKKGQIVIDVGISSGIPEEMEGRTISGDVDFAKVKDVVMAISPVPHGVGPMTVASLFMNLVEVVERKGNDGRL